MRDVGRRSESPDLYLELKARETGGSMMHLETHIGNRSAEPALYATCRLYIDEMLQLSANRQWLKLEAAEMFWNNRDRINFQVFRHPWSIPERHPILEGEKYQLENIELNVGFDFKRAPEVRRYNIGWELRTPRTMPKRQGLKLTVDQAGPRIEEHFYALNELSLPQRPV